jgi:hypothetical protein
VYTIEKEKIMADQDTERRNTINNHESSLAIARHSQGRSIGSENNPNELYSHLLEIASGADVLKSVVDYAHQRGRGICLLGGSGLVAQVTLHLSNGKVGTFCGIFQILSISGKILPPPARVSLEGLTVCLLDTKGQVVMGDVISPLVAFGPVKLTTASFANIAYENLP